MEEARGDMDGVVGLRVALANASLLASERCRIVEALEIMVFFVLFVKQFVFRAGFLQVLRYAAFHKNDPTK